MTITDLLLASIGQIVSVWQILREASRDRYLLRKQAIPSRKRCIFSRSVRSLEKLPVLGTPYSYTSRQHLTENDELLNRPLRLPHFLFVVISIGSFRGEKLK
jgi:hypothetical protein